MQTAWNDWVKQGRPHLTPETSPIGQAGVQHVGYETCRHTRHSGDFPQPKPG